MYKSDSHTKENSVRKEDYTSLVMHLNDRDREISTKEG